MKVEIVMHFLKFWDAYKHKVKKNFNQLHHLQYGKKISVAACEMG